jgi:hypothetical protein
MAGGDEWYPLVISEGDVKREDIEKSYAKLCKEIYELILCIRDEVYEEEEYCGMLSVENEIDYEKECRCLDNLYKVYEITEKMLPKLKALCRKIYLELKHDK